MKILGIVCSPRRSGNTARLVEAVCEGARRRGAKSEIFYLGDLNMGPCNACNSCEITGRCVQEDDMQMIYDALTGTSGVVFGTPIYYDHVSAQAKAFIDRLYAYEWKDSFPRGVKAVVAITYEWDNRDGYDGVLEWIIDRFKRYHHVETVATLKAHDTTKTPVFDRPSLLIEARSIGEMLASGHAVS